MASAVNLRVPGPTPLPSEVRQALARDMIDHRGAEFEGLLRDVTRCLQRFYQTNGDVIVLTASGTGGLEAALVNVLSPGDAVLAVTNGAFGERWGAIATAFGADVRRLPYAWGKALDAADIARALRQTPGVRAILTTHNETSTGVLNDLAPVAELLREMPGERPLWLVDAVSSLGAVELPMDDWGCDIVISASQKAWMAPPGLVFLGVSSHAWDCMAEARCPRYYWDLREARRHAHHGQTPFTPALSTLYALRVALDRMDREGLPAIALRHRELGRQLRAGLKALGLRLFAAETFASPTVTAVWLPDGVSAVKTRSAMVQEGVVVSAGMGEYKERVVRIAHLGYCSCDEIEQTLRVLEAVLASRRADSAGRG